MLKRQATGTPAPACAGQSAQQTHSARHLLVRGTLGLSRSHKSCLHSLARYRSTPGPVRSLTTKAKFQSLLSPCPVTRHRYRRSRCCKKKAEPRAAVKLTKMSMKRGKVMPRRLSKREKRHGTRSTTRAPRTPCRGHRWGAFPCTRIGGADTRRCVDSSHPFPAGGAPAGCG